MKDDGQGSSTKRPSSDHRELVYSLSYTSQGSSSKSAASDSDLLDIDPDWD
ncbi:MAG: hypothetical protein ACFFD4_21825 [Candidatus Odinarchaeota archaeon]